MKKIRLLCLILALLLVVQPIGIGFATEGEPTEETSQSTQTEPAPTEPIVLPTVTGDASITAGCRTINGKVPLTFDPTLLRTAKAAFLYDVKNDVVLFSMNPDEKMYPASVTKVMTCMLILEHLTDMDEIITVTESDLAGIDADASSADLKAGEEMSVENLLYCLMVESANDAGAVLARRVAGSQEAFAEMMNQRAAEIGCEGTHFVNVHGLHDDNHYSTARDLAKIMLEATKNEQFCKLDGTSYYVVPATNLSGERELYTTNLLLGDEWIDTFYDERVTGGKTGYTSAAGRCLVCTAESDGTSLISVILGAQQETLDDGYTVSYYGNFEESGRLLRLGFGDFQRVQVTLKGQTLGQFPVSDGKNDVACGPENDCSALLPGDYSKERLTIQCELTGGVLHAPVEPGQTVGICRIWYGACCLAQTNLLSLSRSEQRVLGENVFNTPNLEQENMNEMLVIAGKVFLVVLAVLVVLAIVGGIRNAVLRARRRRRRRERSAAQRSQRKQTRNSQARPRQKPGQDGKK